MKTKDLRKQKTEELNKKLAELKSELIQLQGEAATGTPPKNPGQINKVKKTIARILTMQQEAEIQELISKNQKNKKTEVKSNKVEQTSKVSSEIKEKNKSAAKPAEKKHSEAVKN